MSDLEDLIARLTRIAEEAAGPFPYEGCRRLRSAVYGRHASLVPDLDLYLGDLAGYRSWGKKILKWPDDKIRTVEKSLARSFFNRYPAYAEMKPIVDSIAPDVQRALALADETREVMLEILSRILSARGLSRG